MSALCFAAIFFAFSAASLAHFISASAFALFAAKVANSFFLYSANLLLASLFAFLSASCLFAANFAAARALRREMVRFKYRRMCVEPFQMPRHQVCPWLPWL